jgi:hypothetical protein
MKDQKIANNFIDLTGHVYNQLTVIELAGKDKFNRYLWKCNCSCGTIVIVNRLNLRNGGTKSCGCLKIQINSKIHKTHGFKTGNIIEQKFYRVWQEIKRRCTNTRRKSYSNYGGRGIKVCDRWIESFENFRDDMYPSYLDHGNIYGFGQFETTLDRIDFMRNYEPSNCRWLTVQKQNLNTRVVGISVNREAHVYWKAYLISSISNLLINNSKKSNKIEPYLGCSLLEFRSYLEFKFLPGMTWNNRGKGKDKWNIDHIRGCNNFDLSIEAERKKCFNYINLRPMWEIDHIKKSTHLITA